VRFSCAASTRVQRIWLLNIVISDEYYLNFFNEIREDPQFAFATPNPDDKAVMVEYSSPNTNKPLHF
jgi:arginyl-tRNA synthetase